MFHVPCNYGSYNPPHLLLKAFSVFVILYFCLDFTITDYSNYVVRSSSDDNLIFSQLIVVASHMVLAEHLFIA